VGKTNTASTTRPPSRTRRDHPETDVVSLRRRPCLTTRNIPSSRVTRRNRQRIQRSRYRGPQDVFVKGTGRHLMLRPGHVLSMGLTRCVTFWHKFNIYIISENTTRSRLWKPDWVLLHVACVYCRLTQKIRHSDETNLPLSLILCSGTSCDTM
jgi:hypothetical protein